VGRTGVPEAVACVLVAPRSLKRLSMGEDDVLVEIWDGDQVRVSVA
jgi:hypothetical protein